MATLRRPLVLLALVFGAAVGGAALAEDLDVGALLNSAKESYTGKHYGKALGDLNLAVGEIARMRMEALKALMPNAPEGWKADDAEGQSGVGLGLAASATTIKRSYKKGDDVGIDLEMLADAPSLFAMYQMYLTGGFTPPGAQIVMVKGRKAILELNKEQKSGTLTILLAAANTSLKLSGRGVTKADLVDTLGSAFDLDAIEKTISN